MAFNPFNVFRRNQKTLFAVLTVFIMVMFTLSFGQGDLFQAIPRWLNAGKRSGEVVAVIDGSKVYQSELGDAKVDRTLANEFMANAFMASVRSLTATLKEQKATATAPTKALVEDVELGLGEMLGGRGSAAQVFAAAEPKLTAVLDNQNSTRDDVDAARTAKQVIEAAGQLATVGQTGRYFYQPNLSNRDAYHGLLWKKKADQLGIRYTADDVPGLVARELFGKFTAAEFRDAQAALLKNKTEYRADRLLAALAAEFNIRAAQSVVLGSLHPRSKYYAPQGVAAPAEGLAYFRELSAGAKIGFMTVPVDNYLAKVTGEPTAAEKQELFTKHRNDEPDPTKDRPGLREPRKLKFEWLEVKGDEPFYKAAAADGLVKGEAQARIGFAVVAPLFAAGWSQVAAAPVATLADAALVKPYDDYIEQQKNQLRDNWYPFSPSLAKPVAATTVKPATLVASGGAAAAALASFGTPYTAAAVFVTRAWAEDRNARVRVFASLLTPPATSFAETVGGFAAGRAREPRPLPLAVVRAELLDAAKADLQTRIATDDTNKFAADLARLGANKDKTEARAAIEKFSKDRGLVRGASTAFHGFYTVGEDPGLAPLKVKADLASFGAQTLPQFGRDLFTETDPQVANNFQLVIQYMQAQRELPRVVSKSLYAPFAFPESPFKFPGSPLLDLRRGGDKAYMVWRTEELPAAAPRTVAEADAKIVAAWKRIKARELAKAAAEGLAKQAEGFGASPLTAEAKFLDAQQAYSKSFADWADQARARFFYRDDVATIPLSQTAVLSPSPQQQQLRPFMLPPSRDIAYPTAAMRDDLLKLREKPVPAAAVYADAGRNEFYVAVVLAKPEITADRYLTDVMNGRGSLAATVTGLTNNQAAEKAREAAVALLKAEFKVEKESEKILSEKGDVE